MRRRTPRLATRVLDTTANAFSGFVHALPRAGSYRRAYSRSAGARENEIASATESANRPRSCRGPNRRAAPPSSPSRSAARRTRSAAAVNRPSATYVIARNPATAFASVIASAAFSLPNRATHDLRDRRLSPPDPRPDPHHEAHALPHPHLHP